MTASRNSGRPVHPEVQALAALPIRPEDEASSRGYSIAVRKAAGRAAVTASKKTGRPVDPRTLGLAD